MNPHLEADAQKARDDEYDAQYERRVEAAWLETRDECAKGAKECYFHIGGGDYEDSVYYILATACHEMKHAETESLSDAQLMRIGVEVMRHVRNMLDHHAKVTA